MPPPHNPPHHKLTKISARPRLMRFREHDNSLLARNGHCRSCHRLQVVRPHNHARRQRRLDRPALLVGHRGELSPNWITPCLFAAPRRSTTWSVLNGAPSPRGRPITRRPRRGCRRRDRQLHASTTWSTVSPDYAMTTSSPKGPLRKASMGPLSVELESSSSPQPAASSVTAPTTRPLVQSSLQQYRTGCLAAAETGPRRLARAATSDLDVPVADSTLITRQS